MRAFFLTSKLNNPLPSRLVIAPTLESGGEIAGILELPHLAMVCTDLTAHTPAILTLAWAKNVFGVLVFEGQLTLELTFACAVCTAPVVLPLDIKLKLGLSQNNDPLSSELETQGLEAVHLAEDGTLDLEALVQEEILLALPIVSKHTQCAVQYAVPEQVSYDTKVNPFAVLSKIKKTD